MKGLGTLLTRARTRWPVETAVEAADGDSVTFEDLADRADKLCAGLVRHGVRPGDRVGLWAPKSIGLVTSLHAVLTAEATIVPVDSASPLDRVVEILEDCSVRAILTTSERCEALLSALGGFALAEQWSPDLVLLTTVAPREAGDAELAYLLYTSGSTGRPKGVMITHAAALSFVDWSGATFDLGPQDRFASHAPFHFDLSILDLYLSMYTGGTLVLIDDATGRQPRLLAPFIAERKISVWYSTPSILALLTQAGQLDRYSTSLRYVLFAGEVFPIGTLRSLTENWPEAHYFNLYGPTETNVCTAYEVFLPIPPDRSTPLPIGRACTHVETSVRDERGHEMDPGQEGELCVRGASVMRGYWNRPKRTAAVFHGDPPGAGASGDSGAWYRTGDFVRDTDEGYVFLGRRDRMVKHRGHRVELGEVEARFMRHPELLEGAAIAATDPEGAVRIEVFLCWRKGVRPSLLALRSFCADHLPAAMIPDRFHHLERLPRTSTDKIDYPTLRSRT